MFDPRPASIGAPKLQRKPDATDQSHEKLSQHRGDPIDHPNNETIDQSIIAPRIGETVEQAAHDSKNDNRGCVAKTKLICSSGEKRAKEVSSMRNQSHNPFRWRHFQSDIILLCVRW